MLKKKIENVDKIIIALYVCLFTLTAAAISFQKSEIPFDFLMILGIAVLFFGIYFILRNKVFIQKRKVYFELFLIIFAIAIVVLFPYLSGSKVFYFNNDQLLQYEYFYDEWTRMLEGFFKGEGFPFYSFQSFLGNDFFSSKLYYVTGDVFLWLIYLFGSVSKGLMYESLLLIVLSSLFFALFLKKFGIQKRHVILVSSIIYAFSGMASIYIGQYMFHRFYTFLPLLIAGIELYREKGKTSLFIIATGICFLSSYYFMFSTSVFLVIYYFFTKHYHENTNVLNVLKTSVKLIISYLIGFLMVGILLIPGILFVLNNPRVGSGVSMNLFFEPQVYVGYFYNFITAPLTLFSKYPYAFGSGFNGHLTWYSFFTTSLMAPVIFSFFSKKNGVKKRKMIMTFVMVLIFSSLLPPLNSIFHGLSDASFRWMFLCVFSNLMVFSIFFDCLDDYRSSISRGTLIYSVLFIFITLFALCNRVFNLEEHRVQIFYTVIAALLMIVLSLFCCFKKEKIALFLCCVEAIVLTDIHLLVLNQEYKFYENSFDMEVMNYLNETNEDLFYRMYADYRKIAPYTDELNLNQSLHYGYRTTQTYDSTYNPGLNEFLKAKGIGWHIIDINDMESLRMLGLKYYYVTDEKDLPTGYDWEYVTNNNNWKVFELTNHRSLGFTYSKFSHNLDAISKENGWNEMLYLPRELGNLIEDIEPTESLEFVVTEFYDDNNIKGTITNDTKQVLFFSIPYDEGGGWSILDNGVPVEVYKVQGGFLGMILEPGEHCIELNFMPSGFKIGVICSAVGGTLFVLMLYLENRKGRKENE